MPTALRGGRAARREKRFFHPLVLYRWSSSFCFLQARCRGWVQPCVPSCCLGDSCFRNAGGQSWNIYLCHSHSSQQPLFLAASRPWREGCSPGFSTRDCWGLRGAGEVHTPLPWFTPMKKKAVRLVIICMLFNIINSVTLHTTSNNDKYCNGNV